MLRVQSQLTEILLQQQIFAVLGTVTTQAGSAIATTHEQIAVYAMYNWYSYRIINKLGYSVRQCHARHLTCYVTVKATTSVLVTYGCSSEGWVFDVLITEGMTTWKAQKQRSTFKQHVVTGMTVAPDKPLQYGDHVVMTTDSIATSHEYINVWMIIQSLTGMKCKIHAAVHRVMTLRVNRLAHFEIRFWISRGTISMHIVTL